MTTHNLPKTFQKLLGKTCGSRSRGIGTRTATLQYFSRSPFKDQTFDYTWYCYGQDGWISTFLFGQSFGQTSQLPESQPPSKRRRRNLGTLFKENEILTLVMPLNTLWTVRSVTTPLLHDWTLKKIHSYNGGVMLGHTHSNKFSKKFLWPLQAHLHSDCLADQGIIFLHSDPNMKPDVLNMLTFMSKNL